MNGPTMPPVNVNALVGPKCQLYELFYVRTGGHGGPWIGLDNAITAAGRLLAGLPSEGAVTIRPYVNAAGSDGYGPPVATVTREHANRKGHEQ